jgi:hypothetical protein
VIKAVRNFLFFPEIFCDYLRISTPLKRRGGWLTAEPLRGTILQMVKKREKTCIL